MELQFKAVQLSGKSFGNKQQRLLIYAVDMKATKTSDRIIKVFKRWKVAVPERENRIVYLNIVCEEPRAELTGPFFYTAMHYCDSEYRLHGIASKVLNCIVDILGDSYVRGVSLTTAGRRAMFAMMAARKAAGKDPGETFEDRLRRQGIKKPIRI